MNLLFLHSPTVRQRAIAVSLMLVVVFTFFFLNPIRFPSLSGPEFAVLLFIDLLLLVLLGVCVKIWRRAQQLPQKELPSPEQWLGPNRIDPVNRMAYIVKSGLLLAYAGYGLHIDYIYIPGKSGQGIHFSGPAAWLLASAIACSAANFLSVVVDHYDRRNNELRYAHFAALCEWLGWSLFGLALVSKFLIQQLWV